MKYIKLYEIFRGGKPIKDEFIKMNDVDYKSFSLKNLKKDCEKYDIDFFDLLEEIVLDKKIAFRCSWCYSIDFSSENIHSHDIIGVCKKITFENPKYEEDSDFLVKIDGEDKWHTLFINNRKEFPKFNVRVYNYTEGLLMQKLEMLKSQEKFNI